MQFFRRRAVVPANPVPALLDSRGAPRLGLPQARRDAGAGHAPHDRRVALPALAFLRCLRARLSARGVSRQRHSAAVGQHESGVRSVSALGGVSPAAADAGGDAQPQRPKSQISVMQDGKRARLYCCHSLLTRDALDELHVLSVGVDLLPALDAQGFDGESVVAAVAESCRAAAATARFRPKPPPTFAPPRRCSTSPGSPMRSIRTASVICPRSGACPRQPRCCVPAH